MQVYRYSNALHCLTNTELPCLHTLNHHVCPLLNKINYMFKLALFSCWTDLSWFTSYLVYLLILACPPYSTVPISFHLPINLNLQIDGKDLVLNPSSQSFIFAHNLEWRERERERERDELRNESLFFESWMSLVH